MAHKDLGMALMKKIEQDLTTMGHPEAEPKLMGKNAFMTLVPLAPGKRKRHFFGEHHAPAAEGEGDEITDLEAEAEEEEEEVEQAN
jgi:translation initiation factor IF-3